ncbi:MAG: sigma 54-interacting transcriptional regulator [Phycisphaerae bacterium]|nr:sigma 54-interacting transcriptional regulator [Phycisphaerae bacterium]
MSADSRPDGPAIPGLAIRIDWDIPKISKVDNIEHYRFVCNDIRKHVNSLFQTSLLPVVVDLKRTNELILDHFTEGVLVHDTNRIITWFNKAAEEITGFDRKEVLGRDCHDVFSGGFCAGKCSFCDNDITPNMNNCSYALNFNAKDGSKKQLNMSVQALRDRDNVFQGILACFKDVTEVEHLRRRLKKVQSFHGIIGRNEKMQEVYELVRDLADSNVPVLVLGESGTGKELIAGAIHGESDRAGKTFVTVNCGALPEGILESELFGHVKGAFTGAIRDKKGRFELADGGTLFLDEIGELSQNMQVKLLRVLQEGTFEPVGGEHQVTVDVRVLSATNRDLRDMVKKGLFREDLFYRLNVVPIELPALRDRRNDIPLLVDFYVNRFISESNRDIQGIAAETMDKMIDYRWPGNIRELQNAIRYAFVKCKGETIMPEHLPPEIYNYNMPTTVAKKSSRKKILDVEKVRQALKSTNGNKTLAAEKLGVGRATLHRFIKSDMPGY